MLSFNLDKQVNLDFYEQIKGQLLSAIYCGKISEGERLPSIRELANDLGVNYKTVRKIYSRLADEQLIDIVQGSGAFLKKRSGEDTYDDMRKRAIFKLLGEVTEKARGLGLSARKFSRLLDTYLTGNYPRRLSLAVIDHDEEAFVFSRELRQRINAEVKAFPLSSERNSEELQEISTCDYLLTTSWHLEEVGQLAHQLGKKTLEIKPSHQIYMEVLAAARDQNVGVVIRDEQTLHASWEVFMNIYHPSTEKKFWIAPIDRDDLIEKILEEADLIFVSPMCWDEMRRRTPAEKELRTYENFISDDTLDQLRELQLLG